MRPSVRPRSSHPDDQGWPAQPAALSMNYFGRTGCGKYDSASGPRFNYSNIVYKRDGHRAVKFTADFASFEVFWEVGFQAKKVDVYRTRQAQGPIQSVAGHRNQRVGGDQLGLKMPE